MAAGDHRKRLYDVFATADEPVEGRLQAALEVGTTYLGLPLGFRTRIEEGIQRIEQVVGDHHAVREGETCPLQAAYCRRTIEEDSPLAVHDAEDSPDIADEAIDAFELGTYIGARVEVDGEIYGTICFADGAVRETPFTGAERHFVELLASLTGQALERQSYEAELAEREAALEEREEIYRAVIDTSFDLVFRIDTGGQFSFVSPGVKELLGYPPGHFVGKPFQTMLPDAETQSLAESLYERVLAGETVSEFYFPLEHRGGKRVHVDIRVGPIYDPTVPDDERSTEAIVGIQGTARDATDRRRREHLIRVLNRVLRHNLRNDMNVISGYAELLTEQLAGEAGDRAERIRRTSDRLSRLAETAQDLEANLATPAQVGPVDLVPIVRRVSDETTAQHPATTLSVELPDEAVVLAAGRVETAIEELLSNAARHAGAAPVIDVTCRTGPETVTLRIADDGPGLPEQERAVLEAGDESPLVHGSGLGLWLVHWIVESLDGQLLVLEAGAGTSIELQLPRVEAPVG